VQGPEVMEKVEHVRAIRSQVRRPDGYWLEEMHG